MGHALVEAHALQAVAAGILQRVLVAIVLAVISLSIRHNTGYTLGIVDRLNVGAVIEGAVAVVTILIILVDSHIHRYCDRLQTNTTAEGAVAHLICQLVRNRYRCQIFTISVCLITDIGDLFQIAGGFQFAAVESITTDGLGVLQIDGFQAALIECILANFGQFLRHFDILHCAVVSECIIANTGNLAIKCNRSQRLPGIVFQSLIVITCIIVFVIAVRHDLGSATGIVHLGHAFAAIKGVVGIMVVHWQSNFRQAGSRKDRTAHVADLIRDRDAFQLFAIHEGPVSNIGQHNWQLHVHHTGASFKGRLANIGQTVG